MTGKHSGHATIRDNLEYRPEGQQPIFDSEVTIAEVLGEAGYASGCFGKWGLGFPKSEGDPLRQGFDRFYGYNCQRHAHSFYPRYLWDDDEHVELPGNDRQATGVHYSHDWIEREILAKGVPGGLFDPNEQRAVNHDETQRAAWVTWENGGGRLTIPLASAEEPLDLSEEAS